MENVYYYNTKIGKISIVENGAAITKICFINKDEFNVEGNETELLRKAIKQLEEFFEGERNCFDLPLAPKGRSSKEKYGVLYKRFLLEKQGVMVKLPK